MSSATSIAAASRPESAWGEGAVWEETAAFCRDSLNPLLAGRAPEEFPRSAWKAAGEFALLGMPVGREYGGRGASAMEAAERLEALGYACEDNGFLAALCAHLLSCVIPVWLRGNDDQRERFLKPMCSGEMVAAHAATEPTAGSDIFALRTTARREGDDYVLDGQKAFSLSVPDAGVYIVFANLDPEFRPAGITGFLVERDRPGLSVTMVRRKIGLKTAGMGDLELAACRVPAANRLGAEGSGSLIFQLSMRWERTLIVAPQVGMMRRVLEKCVRRACERTQFGQPIGRFQSVANRIADMKVRLELSRLALMRAAELLAAGRRDAVEPSIAKLFISESALQTSIDALRIHGASGYMEDAEFGHDVDDALGMTILSGTSDIQRQIIARSLGL
jgi:alkylation response protein AidB-like acyl-CoA dehydrogenase